ncbi:MAG: FHA domain-containing protein [Deltaproteobacteria bacterium]|nr:FHA domain-containing protein [Deltaproteobacteria bacterium]
MIICPNCKQENADDYIYCLYCGSELRITPTVPPTPSNEPIPLTNVVSKPQNIQSPSGISGVQSMPWDQVIPNIPDTTRSSQAPTIPQKIEVVPPPIPQSVPTTSYTPPPISSSAPVIQEKRCPQCNNVVPPGFRFCGFCGFQISGEQLDSQAKGRTVFMQAVMPVEKPKPIFRAHVIKTDGTSGPIYTLSTKETLFGRTKGLILLADDKYVSPLHGRFKLENDELYVVDENSLNGIYKKVNGEVEIHSQDYFRVGKQLLRFDTVREIEEINFQKMDGDDSLQIGSTVLNIWGRIVQILEGARVGETRLLVNNPVVFGREVGEILYPYDGFMSSKHAQIEMRESRFFLKDLGSSNGTFIRIKGTEKLNNGDILLIGLSLIRIEIR